jgi:O-antigen/teichoic acid export membrane protein
LSKQIVKWTFIINLPLFLIILIFPGVALNILFGTEYLAAENALMILSIGGLFVSLTTIFSTLLFIKGKSKLVLLNILVVALFNVILDILLIPKYGLEGAAFATLLSNILFGVAALIETKIYFGFIPLRKKMLSIFIASFIPLLLIIFIKELLAINILSLILIGILFVLVYLITIYIIKGFDENDALIIDSIKKRLFIYSPNRSY